jgi:hypothetical protein
VSRRTDSPELTVITWRDIPAQVMAKSGRQVVKRELPARFQVAIDRAAMRAGLHGSDAYLTEWRRTSRTCDDDLERAVSDELDRIESTFTQDLLNSAAEAGGTLDPQQPTTEQT